MRIMFVAMVLAFAPAIGEAQQPFPAEEAQRMRVAASKAMEADDIVRAHRLLVPLCEQADGWACHSLGVIEYSLGQIVNSRHARNTSFAKSYLFFTAAEKLGYAAAKGAGARMAKLVTEPAAIERADELLAELSKKQEYYRKKSPK